MADMKNPADGDQAHSFVSEAVRQGIALAKLDWQNEAREHEVQHDPVFVDWLDKHLAKTLRVWAAGVMLAYAVPAGWVAYEIGGMANQLHNALEDQRINTQSLQARGGWMEDQEQFNCDMRRAVIDLNPEAEITPCRFVDGQDRSDRRR